MPTMNRRCISIWTNANCVLRKWSGSREANERAMKLPSMLIPDDLDDALPLREECSTADFVVEHLEPSDDPAVLGRLGSYDVLDIIGRGGMGVVLKGFDRELKRFVAIKALAPHLAHSALARKRFAREAQAAAAVVNLHVIAIHQVQPNGQLPFLVMPLLTGESLAQRTDSARDIGAEGDSPHRDAGRRRTRGGSRARAHPSRCQTGEHPARKRSGTGRAHGLRIGTGRR